MTAPATTITLTRAQHAQLVAALALAAQQYADPSLVYETLNVVAPGTGSYVRALIAEGAA